MHIIVCVFTLQTFTEWANWQEYTYILLYVIFCIATAKVDRQKQQRRAQRRRNCFSLMGASSKRLRVQSNSVKYIYDIHHVDIEKHQNFTQVRLYFSPSHEEEPAQRSQLLLVLLTGVTLPPVTAWAENTDISIIWTFLERKRCVLTLKPPTGQRPPTSRGSFWPNLLLLVTLYQADIYWDIRGSFSPCVKRNPTSNKDK